MLKLGNINSNPTSDYDNVSESYDEYYSKYLGAGALEMLDKLPIGDGDNVLDIACGTGFFTHRLAEKVGSSGSVTAVDVSSGMLKCNQRNASSKGLLNIDFFHADALHFLSSVPSGSVDGIVCGWGICYMNHKELLKEMARIIKPKGFMGIIENRECSLADVSSVFKKALIDYPQALVKNMLIKLPKDKDYLIKTFCGNTFTVKNAWDGQVVVPCSNGNDILDYMIKSGASAGFIDSLDKELSDKVMSKFIFYADEKIKNGVGVVVSHDFSVLVAEKA